MVQDDEAMYKGKDRPKLSLVSPDSASALWYHVVLVCGVAAPNKVGKF